MLKINETWSIDRDSHCFHLCRRCVSKKAGTEPGYRRYYYPTLEQLINGLIDREVLDADCADLRELSSVVSGLRQLVSDVAGHLPSAMRCVAQGASKGKTPAVIPFSVESLSETAHGGDMQIFTESSRAGGGVLHWLGIRDKSDSSVKGWIGFVDFSESTLLSECLRVCRDALGRCFAGPVRPLRSAIPPSGSELGLPESPISEKG